MTFATALNAKVVMRKHKWPEWEKCRDRCNVNEILIFFRSLHIYAILSAREREDSQCDSAIISYNKKFLFLENRYDDVRSPLPQSISQMSLYNNNNTSGVYQQSSGIIEPLPFHHNNHRPVPIPPSSRSLISDYNSSSKSHAAHCFALL